MQIILFCLAIGQQPHNLHVFITNTDAGVLFNTTTGHGANFFVPSQFRDQFPYAITHHTNGTSTLKLSDIYINALGLLYRSGVVVHTRFADTSTVTIERVPSITTGTDAIREGAAWATLQMLESFSKAIFLRFTPDANASLFADSEACAFLHCRSYN